MDALQVACVGKFPGQTDRSIEPTFELRGEVTDGHEGSPMFRVN